jgi:hypothetical protein
MAATVFVIPQYPPVVLITLPTASSVVNNVPEPVTAVDPLVYEIVPVLEADQVVAELQLPVLALLIEAAFASGTFTEKVTTTAISRAAREKIEVSFFINLN